MTTLSALEKVEGNNHLNHITYAYPFRAAYTPVLPLPLFKYCELIQSIKNKKGFRMFTHNPTAFPHPNIPNLYFTNLGSQVFQIVLDNTQNPYTTGKFKNTLIHPEIYLLSQLMLRHGIIHIPLMEYQRIEHVCEICFADFKVHTSTRAFMTQINSWNTKLRYCNNSYDRFIKFICAETNKFEVHSLLVQRKLRNSLVSVSDTTEFLDKSAYEIVREKSNEIIQAVWRMRQQNGVLGILSREEMDIEQTSSIRLIFFVRKDFSDLIPFSETSLSDVLTPYLIDHNLDCISLGTVQTMNSGIAPHFQGQEQNYYDLTQIHAGTRLNILKAQLIVPDYWFRIRDDSCSLIVERGQTHYER
ncbi:hypothetical protein F993_03661 [Acinetobacter proteolyticus]|uniref:Uncharacterized protein n=1 Tax=Acinetobacter proteolyticus TaxID=1776741 RepID=A0ABN0J9D0_9GAMM|nr:hypothetical protein [Acinetobacter proteolyticus]ENU21739.1 hypothetical protein F993_03661 [Acinetobacter proteolyticus]